MRTPASRRTVLSRLASTVAVAGLLTTTLAVAAPAQAEENDGVGTVTVKIRDDLGNPVKGLVQLVPVAGYGSYELLEPDGDSFQSEYTSTDIPVGQYAVMTLGGWPLMSCAGVTPCDLVTLMNGGIDEDNVTPVLWVTDNGPAATYTMVTATPKLAGAARVGETLTVRSAVNFGEELGAVLDQVIAPKVVWRRNGTVMEGVQGTRYTVRPRDVGKRLSVTVNYPGAMKLLMSALGSPEMAELFPGPVSRTSAAVVKNRSTTRARVSGGTLQVSVTGDVDEVVGWVKVTLKGRAPIWARVHEGFAPIALPRLKPGRHKVTVAYQGNGELSGSKDSTTYRVKRAKAKPRR